MHQISESHTEFQKCSGVIPPDARRLGAPPQTPVPDCESEKVATLIYSPVLLPRRLMLTQSTYFNGGTTPKTASSFGRSGPPANTWFLGPTRVHNPNGIAIGSTDETHTHRQTTLHM